MADAARTFCPILELGRDRRSERGLEATPSPGSDCQRSEIIFQIMYLVLDYLVWVMQSTIKRGRQACNRARGRPKKCHLSGPPAGITISRCIPGPLRVCLPPLFLVARLDRFSQKNRVPMSNARFVRNLLSMSFAPSFDAGSWIKENLQGEDKYNETRR
jgi:hypothetical protein